MRLGRAAADALRKFVHRAMNHPAPFEHPTWAK